VWIHCVFSDTWRAQRVVSIGGVKRVGCAFNVVMMTGSCSTSWVWSR
jgi:hypothetical protein